MYKSICLFVFCFVTFCAGQLLAQDLKTSVNDNKLLDSLRKREEGEKDSVVFTSKYVRYTTLKLTKDSIQTLGLDTSLNGFHNFSVIAQPRNPTIGTGNLGLPAMPMLFEPLKTIGFDAGFHSMDYYEMTHDDVKYYQARTPFTNLYYVSVGEAEQVFKVTHSQNIKPNWNIGANYNRIGANGYYMRQRGDHLNAAIFNWYQSPNKRYNLWVNGLFNTLKANENGSIRNESIFTTTGRAVTPMAENVRLGNARQISRKNSFLIRQSYFVGRIDSVAQEITDKILPTNKVTYTFKYNVNSFAFQKDETDDHSVLPPGVVDATFTNDSTRYTNVQNEFIYSFFLRAKSTSIIKNELKLDAGIRHDYYSYMQGLFYEDKTPNYEYNATFQNVTLLGNAGYRFSNRIDLNVDLQQIVQGRNLGDFMYEAKSNVLLSNSVGRVVLGAYFQNKSPEEVYTRFVGNHYRWVKSFDRTKTINFSFKYLNEKLKLEAGAEYFLLDKYLYFSQVGGTGADSLAITPNQSGTMNMLKITLGKRLSFGKFNINTFGVYQKTDNPNILRTPELYAFASIYMDQTFFKVLRTNIGFDIRYNTAYTAYSYSPGAAQFYNGAQDVTFESTPIVDFFVKASLRKANIFVKTDYANQGLLSKGYYTVDRYPMANRVLIKFGVSWNFYD